MTSRPLHQQYIIYKGDESVEPDPAELCPANGYIDPTDPDDPYVPDIPGTGSWELLFLGKTNSPASTSFDPYIYFLPQGGNKVTAWRVGNLIIYDTTGISEVLDGSLQEFGFYRKVGSGVTMFNIVCREDHIVGNVKIGILGDEAGSSFCNIDFDNNAELTYLSFDQLLSPLANIWIRNTGYVGTLDLSGITKLTDTTNSELALSGNPGMTALILPPVSKPVSGNLRFFSIANTGISGTIDLRAFLKIKNIGASKPSFTFDNTRVQYIIFNDAVEVAEFKTLYAANCNLTGVLDLRMLNSWSTTNDTDIRLLNNPNLTGVLLPPTLIAGGTRYLLLQNCNLTGVLDLRMITILSSSGAELYGYGNKNLTGVLLPTTISGKLRMFTFGSCNITGTLDLSMFTEFPTNGVQFLVATNPNLTGIVFPATPSGPVASLVLNHTGLSGILDLSMFTSFTTAGLIQFNNTGITGIILSATDITVKTFTANNCSLTGTLDLRKCPKITALQLQSNPNLTSVLLSSTHSDAFTLIYMYLCDLTGTLDLSTIGIANSANIRIYSNPNLTGVLLPSSSATVLSFYAYSCSLGYIDFTVMPNMTKVASLWIQLQGNGMTAEEVNHILVDLDSISSTGYSSRRIHIHGTNAAPDSSSGGYDGLSAKANLIAKGFSVLTN